jgi:hypothetical protein
VGGARHALVTVVLGAAVLAGCQGASAPPPPATLASAERLRAEGDARRERGDHEGAFAAYRQAAGLEPGHLVGRYLLGVTAAHLDRHDEAVEAFTWVVEQGAAEREEVRIARQWLIEAGVLQRPAAGQVAAAETTAGGTLRGRTEWRGVDPSRPVPRLQILLDGDDPITRGKRYATRVNLNEPYTLANVQPGRYRVIAGVGMTKLWLLSITVDDGKPTVLDLTPAVSSAPPDALAPPAS